MVTRAVLLLAGGGSTRLGRDKRLASVAGAPLYVRAATLAQQTRLPVFAAAGPGDVSLPACSGVAVLREPPPVEGALRAVTLWLRAFDHELVVLAADLPLLSLAFLRTLLRAADAAPHAHAAVARSSGGLEPLCALYRPRLLPALEAARAGGQQSLSRVLADLDADLLVRVDVPAERLLLNVNDRTTLEAARKLAKA